MSKITKKELRQRCIDNETAIASLESILKENGIELQPLLKQLDQSIFDGLDEKWRFAAVDRGGLLKAFTYKPKLSVSMTSFILLIGNTIDIGTGYDASNWQNSLIERNTVKELLEVDCSELTGSDLARAMLARGDKYVMCKTSGTGEAEAMEAKYPDVIQKYDWEFFYTPYKKRYAVPINNQGEPLTASEVGL